MQGNPTGSPYQREFQQLARQLRERIITRRKEQGLTQEDMQLHGLSLRQFQRIESGETENLTLANLLRIAIALKTTPAELIGS